MFLHSYVHFHELFLLLLEPHNHTGLVAKKEDGFKTVSLLRSILLREGGSLKLRSGNQVICS